LDVPVPLPAENGLDTEMLVVHRNSWAPGAELPSTMEYRKDHAVDLNIGPACR
jgi:hypothetical protein